jgi:hypothetical protein
MIKLIGQHYLERTYINTNPRPKAITPTIKNIIAKAETIPPTTTIRTGRWQFKKVPADQAQQFIQLRNEDKSSREISRLRE